MQLHPQSLQQFYPFHRSAPRACQSLSVRKFYSNTDNNNISSLYDTFLDRYCLATSLLYWGWSGIVLHPLPNVKKNPFDMDWYYLSIHRVWKILDWCHVPPHCKWKYYENQIDVKILRNPYNYFLPSHDPLMFRR